MICQTCQRRSDCLPAALAAQDTRLYALLEKLQGCDRYAAVNKKTPEASSKKWHLPQLFARHLA